MKKQEFPAIHPGEFLDETLRELKISQAEFARAIGISFLTSYVASFRTYNFS
ncbi:MAG: hypothetical protein MRJ52_04360 [Nitrosomonas sp.]|nr:hypothetical protein [Nitrosomonas sp.]